MKALKKNLFAPLKNQEGRVGYLIAWMMGVPVSLLFFIFLLRGH